MKTLYLVRHARAKNQTTGKSDFDRELTKKGEKDAVRIANQLAKCCTVPGIMISSPAKRAKATASIFARKFNYHESDVMIDDSIYEDNQSIHGLLNILSKIDERNQSAMIIGHDPMLSGLAQFLNKDFNDTLAKGGVLCLEFNNHHWNKINKGRGMLRFYCYPDQKSALKVQLKKQLRDQLAKQLLATLANRDNHRATLICDHIWNASYDIAKLFYNVYPDQKAKKMKSNR